MISCHPALSMLARFETGSRRLFGPAETRKEPRARARARCNPTRRSKASYRAVTHKTRGRADFYECAKRCLRMTREIIGRIPSASDRSSRVSYDRLDYSIIRESPSRGTSAEHQLAKGGSERPIKSAYDDGSIRPENSERLQARFIDLIVELVIRINCRQQMQISVSIERLSR